MGIDLIRGGRTPNRGRRETKTTNTYIKTLIKVECEFNAALLIPGTKDRVEVQYNNPQETEPVEA